MATSVYCKNILNHMLEAEHGEELMLDFGSHGERDSFRTTLYRERAKLAKMMPAAVEKIVIKQVSDENGIYLSVKKDQHRKQFSGKAALKKADGTITTLDLTNKDSLRTMATEAGINAPPVFTRRQKHLRLLRNYKVDGKCRPEYIPVDSEILVDKLETGELTWEMIQTPESLAEEQAFASEKACTEEKPKQELSGEPTLKEMLTCMKEAGEITNPLFSEMTVGELAYQVVEKGVSFDTLQEVVESKMPTTVEELLNQKVE